VPLAKVIVVSAMTPRSDRQQLTWTSTGWPTPDRGDLAMANYIEIWPTTLRQETWVVAVAGEAYRSPLLYIMYIIGT
jgi:hypothetical protein